MFFTGIMTRPPSDLNMSSLVSVTVNVEFRVVRS